MIVLLRKLLSKLKDERLFQTEAEAALLQAILDPHPSSIPLFDQALERNPRDARFYGYRAEAHFQAGCYEKAVEDWQVYLKLGAKEDSFESHLVHFRLGESFEKLGLLEQACEMYGAGINDINDLQQSGWRIKDALPENFLVPLYLKRAQVLELLGQQTASEVDNIRVQLQEG